MVNVGNYTIHGPYGKYRSERYYKQLHPREKNHHEAEVPSLASSFSKGKNGKNDKKQIWTKTS